MSDNDTVDTIKQSWFSIIKQCDLLRMSHFLILAICLYSFAIILASYGMNYFPQLQTVSWKLGHITIGAYLGYWIDRHCTHMHVNENSSQVEHIRRAIIIASVIIGISIGM